MEAINSLIQTYAAFFDGEMWLHVLTDPVSWGLMGTLVVLEGLLSADNALVLAVMVRDLPESQRRKALFYGLLGAYTFRFIAIGLGVWLVQIQWVKIIGALYLAWLAFRYFNPYGKKEEAKQPGKAGFLVRLFGPFWGTVAAVELVDIAFSIDSVLAAFGVSKEVWILFIGGVLGVLMMRTVAGLFIKMIDRIPELETTAYVLIALISVKMLLSVASIEISHAVFLLIMAIAFSGALILNFLKKRISFS